MARKKKKVETTDEPVVETDITETETSEVVDDVVFSSEEAVEVVTAALPEETIDPPVIEEAPKSVPAPEIKAKAKSPYPSIDEMFNRYMEGIASGNSQVAIKSLSSMFYNLALKGTKSQLDYTLKLFRENKEKVLDVGVALRSIQGLSRTIRIKVEILFTVFYKLIKNAPNGINIDIIRKETNNEDLIAWIQSKIKQ